ncbi:hypothetical protein [Rubripirellula reticaptiva]|uniref:Uncharacterized protein n=1 Tax=Rubripirellula reticaptiva TaxID=2528013 RepID=A0A5C6FBJ2_9BACT|nr:hypothetical protein [Rubripirellula reticaptiva]TWU57927.1 hypothetical protein Poly59_08360 [Rubripirellula reticaptiva]
MRSLLSMVIFVGLTLTAAAQNFEMFEPSGVVVARVEIRPGRLVMYEGLGARLFFSREPRYDSIDGRFAGYFNFELNRILRFPRSGRGQMETADLDDFNPSYRLTRRLVRPLGDRHSVPVPLHVPGYLGPGYLGPGYVGPGYLGPGYVSPGLPGPFITAPGFGIPPQVFGASPLPGFGGIGPIGPPLPQSVLIDSQTIPNPPLEPVRVQLRNGGPREIQVGVVDLKTPAKTQSLRIAPGSSADVMLEREAGARQIQNFRVITPLGDSQTREIVNDVPATVRYEIVVHEWKIQSVAIDRTAGAGDNPIEDINFHGKSIGRFPLPPGDQLQPGSIDVYRAARNQGNAAAVAPILAEEDNLESALDPLERAILETQQNFQRNR